MAHYRDQDAHCPAQDIGRGMCDDEFHHALDELSCALRFEYVPAHIDFEEAAEGLEGVGKGVAPGCHDQSSADVETAGGDEYVCEGGIVD